MKNKNIIVTVTLIFLLILVFTMYFVFERKSSNSTTQNPTPYLPSTFPVSTRTQTKPSVTNDFYKNLDKQSDYQPFTALNPNKPITQMRIEKNVSIIPEDLFKMPLYSYEYDESDKKYNPQLTFGANIQNDSLIIYQNPSETVYKTIMLSKNLQSSNFAWISNDLIVLEEKAGNIVRFYLVNANSAAKAFLIDDHDIVGGTAMDRGPEAFNKEKTSIIALTSNEGDYWQLVLSQD